MGLSGPLYIGGVQQIGKDFLGPFCSYQLCRIKKI